MLNSPTDSNPFQYAGMQSDASGLYYAQARYYNPAWGRFMSSDPAGFGGGVNPFVYAGDNPINASDPGGAILTSKLGSHRMSSRNALLMLLAAGLDIVADADVPIGVGVGGALDEPVTLTLPRGVSLPPAGASAAPTWTVVEAPPDAFPSNAGADDSNAVPLWQPGQPLPPGYVDPAPGGPCFPAGTPIATRSGQKPIEAIRAGDEVLSADPATGKQSYQKVVSAFRLQATELLTVVMADGRSVEATPVHPFWVQGKGFVAAKLLAKGNRLRDARGHLVAITRITPRRGKFTVYNFTVTNTHTYYAGGWWVHNADLCTQIAVQKLMEEGNGWVHRLESADGAPFIGPSVGGGDPWNFHEVWVSDGGMVYDPMQYGEGLVPFETWWNTPTANAPYMGQEGAYGMGPVGVDRINPFLR